MDELSTPTSPTTLVTADALAVASLAFAMTSFGAFGLFQWVAFLLDQVDPVAQYLVAAAPVLLLGALAALCARSAHRRTMTAAWAPPVAGAGLLLGSLAAALSLLGIVIALAVGDGRY